jgi:hypothetical protein
MQPAAATTARNERSDVHRTGLGPAIGDPNNQAAVFNPAQDQSIIMPTTASGTLFALDWFHRRPVTPAATFPPCQGTEQRPFKEQNNGHYAGPCIVVDNGEVGPVPKGTGHFSLILQATPSNYLWVETLSSVNDGNWHFLVATYDGSGQAGGIRLYIDGSLATTTTNTNTLNGLTTLKTVPVTIGSRDMGGGPYNGLLAEAAIFGNALTPSLVRQLQNDAGSSSGAAVLSHFAVGGGCRRRIR